MPASPDAIVQELLSRGVSPDDIAAVNPSLGQRAKAGLIAPRLVAPDKIAERGAYIRDYGGINKDRDDLAKTYAVKSDLDRFSALNQDEATGGWKSLPLVKNVVEAFDPKFNEMSGIASGLQGRARPVGSGATSDFEQRLYRMGVPSPEKTGPVNASIAAHMKATMAEQNDRLAFQEEFLRRNGSLSGSQDAWGRYVAANPYAVSKDGRTALNTQRKDWKAHFGLASDPAPASTASLPKPQAAAAQMFKGAKGGMGTPTNPYVPASAQEFDRLPAGVTYLDTDGRVKTKRH